jgi:hypothetical protein
MANRVLHITFDSNVWRKVASPSSFPKEQSAAIFEKLNLLSRSREIVACLSETIFNLEGIEKIKRKRIIGDDRGKIERQKPTFDKNICRSGFTIGPDLNAHPGSGDYLLKHLIDARISNFKILYCPRLGGSKNRDLLESDYLNCSEEISSKFSDTVSEIESWGCGKSQVVAIGHRFAEFWLDGLQAAPASEQKNIEKAIAEWSDADSVAAHIAYGNDIFCTRDQAKSAGSKSVFHASNITRLREKYGFLCQKPEELDIDI